MKLRRNLAIFLGLLVLAGSGCQQSAKSTTSDHQLTVGVSFETLQTEYWVASISAIRKELEKRNIKMLELISNGDASRQLDQIKSFIVLGVDGIIVAPKNASAIAPGIRDANRAGIPIVLYNRPAAAGSGDAPAVVANNRSISRDTVRHLCELARKSGRKYKAMVVVGDLGDLNAIGRKQGFDDAVAEYKDVIEATYQAPSEWDQAKALNSITNLLQAHKDINLIFTSSDFLLPSVKSALKTAGKYHLAGHPEHVLLGGFDGDSTAYKMLQEGYLDADGVQDLAFECATAVKAILDMRAGKKVTGILDDPGLVIHRGNLAEAKARMWGAQVNSN